MPKEVHKETLMCGYRRCCPVITVFEDGSIELFDDDDENDSEGLIKLRPEAVARLVELVTAHKKGT